MIIIGCVYECFWEAWLEFWCEAWLKEDAEPADNLGDRNDWLTKYYGGNGSKGDTPRVCFDMKFGYGL